MGNGNNKLIGPSGKEWYNHSAVTLSCRLSPEISAVNMEIRWFKETDCVCVYKNREVTEGKDYRGRVSLFTQELERGNVSLKLRNCTETDFGYYLCQVTNGDRTEDITVQMGSSVLSRMFDKDTWVCQSYRKWTEVERLKIDKCALLIELRNKDQRILALENEIQHLRRIVPWRRNSRDFLPPLFGGLS
ncbi:hypothetical protein KOW79_021766 [Hemibagrus wyckioides]|uniref:Ig-like domain-containing protein n=1 Tax=Hemibagrus wyckioides TaxID=337641 RepID=A0A9D3SC18_9TELE|nr:myelin-oligodendrocyte glycoprotein-like [Hemibagrus wyckioides]XP_058239113.1 myelin-oligodendrocyte glycoprotein-like [Hemibagrus wyckioides]KAG7314463.1 hypothetical protein KOW79_021766 [Hemibagrus wyckioides]